MRLIDADALRQKIENWKNDADKGNLFSDSVESFAYDEVLCAIDVAPTIKSCSMGRWAGKGMDVRCSECGESPIMDMDIDTCWFWSFRPKFCPNCGAVMIGERK